MPDSSLPWQIHTPVDLPEDFVQAVRQHTGELPGCYAAQLLWQRGIRNPKVLAGFLNPKLYQPTSPFAFGQEMTWAVERLQRAWEQEETVAIWGDFDADGITATAVLWEGLGAFFPQTQHLVYYIPNRLTESHGLAIAPLHTLAAQGVTLIVTCDTGSTNLDELTHAHTLGIDVIITDHHTLPEHRPPVQAILNPRALPPDHPLAHLSGVAVAYKLVEAVYQTLPASPTYPLTDLLDLVAIGLIADLVELQGDCRYLAQLGIEQLQQTTRPGLIRLLELCKRSGDRPTDISYGIGPRINAISRIHGDARFGVELLTSRDATRCRQLADETELANTRRKALQRDVVQQVKARLAQIDLSTTHVIVLADPQWPVGVLGLVAGQIAQEYGRPTILLTIEDAPGDAIASPQLARGSARSAHAIDLYQLVRDQAHLLQRFGGHPYAAGLSLPVENLPFFTEAINRQLREHQWSPALSPDSPLQADLRVTVAELGKDLFRELKLLEPYGMGNPVPQLLIQNCWFDQVQNQNIRDWRGQKVRYIKTEFRIWDETVNQGFPGIWWEHYKDDIPAGRGDAIAELDFNTYRKQYEIRLIALRPRDDRPLSTAPQPDWILDWRTLPPAERLQPEQDVLVVQRCPSSWDELHQWFRVARQSGQPLAIAYPPPPMEKPLEIWQRLVGIAKYISRTNQSVTRLQLLNKLSIGDRTLQFGFKSLQALGFTIQSADEGFSMVWNSQPVGADADVTLTSRIDTFLTAIQEEQFRQHYFYQVPLTVMQAIANRHASRE